MKIFKIFDTILPEIGSGIEEKQIDMTGYSFRLITPVPIFSKFSNSNIRFSIGNDSSYQNIILSQNQMYLVDNSDNHAYVKFSRDRIPSADAAYTYTSEQVTPIQIIVYENKQESDFASNQKIELQYEEDYFLISKLDVPVKFSTALEINLLTDTGSKIARYVHYSINGKHKILTYSNYATGSLTGESNGPTIRLNAGDTLDYFFHKDEAIPAVLSNAQVLMRFVSDNENNTRYPEKDFHGIFDETNTRIYFPRKNQIIFELTNYDTANIAYLTVRNVPAVITKDLEAGDLVASSALMDLVTISTPSAAACNPAKTNGLTNTTKIDISRFKCLLLVPSGSTNFTYKIYETDV